jgi:tRNA(Ser,Leu) C12 N-acetylase TAN1
MKLTDVVDRPNVDLNNPDKIIRVDIIGKDAAISLLKKQELLNTSSFK